MQIFANDKFNQIILQCTYETLSFLSTKLELTDAERSLIASTRNIHKLKSIRYYP